MAFKSISGRFLSKLSSRLLLLTIGFVMLAELLLFVPSAALFRQDWLGERAQHAGLMAQALTEMPDYQASEVLTEQFIKDTDVMMVSAKRDGMTELILGSPPEAGVEMLMVDLRGGAGGLSIRKTFSDLLSHGSGFLRVLSDSPVIGQDGLELLIPRVKLRWALRDYLWRIFGLSLLIAVITGGLIYLSMSVLIIRPIQNLVKDMEYFRDNPSANKTVSGRPPRQRTDEIGQLQREFKDVKQTLRATFRQRERLAGLGLAVAKINHDLRNVLTSALLISDRLSGNKDPDIATMGERLTRTVERGIGLSEDVLSYSRAESADPEPQDVRVAMLIGEAAADVVRQFETVKFRNQVPSDLEVRTDPDHAYRIFNNLFRNAAQAMVSQEGECLLKISAQMGDGFISLIISDTGPGLPKRARENLFQAFAGGQSHEAGSRSTGLGLSISKELAKAQGGDLCLISSDKTGTRFRLDLPKV